MIESRVVPQIQFAGAMLEKSKNVWHIDGIEQNFEEKEPFRVINPSGAYTMSSEEGKLSDGLNAILIYLETWQQKCPHC